MPIKYPTGGTGSGGGSAFSIDEGTSFPGSPAAGQFFSLLADDTNGVEWLFRRNAANTKWRFQGGAALLVDTGAGAAETTTSASAVELTTPVAITIPVATSGFTFEIEWGGFLSESAAGTVSTLVSIDGGVPASLTHGCPFLATGVQGAAVSRKIRAAVTTSVTVKYTASAGTLSAARRWLAMRPVST